MSKITDLNKIVENGDFENVEAAVQSCLDDGIEPMDVLNEGLVEPINQLGEKFANGDIFVPELLIASRAMKQGAAMLKPLIVSEDNPSMGKAVFCTVEGDMHDIGKNLVVMLLESAGFEVEDLGMDISPEAVVEAVQNDESIKIIGMSAMLTTTMYAMQETIEALTEAGLRDRVKIMVGGAPVHEDFANMIGADGFSTNAPTAVDLAEKLIAQ